MGDFTLAALCALSLCLKTSSSAQEISLALFSCVLSLLNFDYLVMMAKRTES